MVPKCERYCSGWLWSAVFSWWTASTKDSCFQGFLGFARTISSSSTQHCIRGAIPPVRTQSSTAHFHSRRYQSDVRVSRPTHLVVEASSLIEPTNSIYPPWSWLGLGRLRRARLAKITRWVGQLSWVIPQYWHRKGLIRPGTQFFYSGHDQGGHVQLFYWPICPYWPPLASLAHGTWSGWSGGSGGSGWWFKYLFSGPVIWIVVVFST